MSARGLHRPMHLRPAMVGWVFLGGAVGSLFRGMLATFAPTVSGQWPWATLTVNLTGALLLGALLEVLSVSNLPGRLRAPLQLGLGTGLLGGYTTYSTFAVDALTMSGVNGPWPALAYVFSTVVGGFLAAFCATIAVRWLTTRRRGRKP